MLPSAETVTITIPRSAVQDVLALSADLTDRMHALLERNTDGNLTPIERSELDTLVRIVHVGQIISMSLQPGGLP